ncbi:hypothetical protein OGAPHI_006652 [Ogataea philodendri]|uniref:Vacuolar protein sorting-associated protein VTA1 n=1 Tax=Ogataea philodendri TaxID=1378263 RepID=A0A9P8NWW6_9ASCO|nr:uncharacterized protein OGAPHI_006652 [Ogataea philodendri]KAH3661245.1 hypothetical protein OGAPHI_006652 [Ogataea philodendri]
MSLPPDLKLIAPFIKRSTELTAVQPTVAYLCKLYAAELILNNQLHLKAKDIETYALGLLDEIEKDKLALKETSEKSYNLINDPESSFKLVWGFATSIFNRSFNEIANHTASKKTVDNFKAALDFYQVLNLWPEQLDSRREELEKSKKYAKFHSMRILKALKNNQDPNDYVTPEEEREVGSWSQDQPQDDDDDDAVSLPEPPSEIRSPEKSEHASPVASPPLLPSAPDSLDESLNLPAAPAIIKEEPNKLGMPKAPVKLPKPSPPQAKAPEHPPLSKEDISEMIKTDEVISQAQKRAKFAISALNYEDVETAIKELQQALELLQGK